MELIIQLGNVLEAEADGLIITVDGATPGLEGSVGGQFARRWPDKWDEIIGSAGFPVPLGRTVHLPAGPPMPFKFVFLASTLDHSNRAGRQAMAAYMRSALHGALQTARSLNLTTLTSPLLKGGWRMATSVAFDAMVQVSDEFRSHDVTLTICARDAAEFDLLAGLGLGYGIRTTT